MEKRIIYKTEEGGVAIVSPSKNCGRTIEEIAKKDVPYGRPYKILDADVVNSNDRTFRNAWEVEESELTDGIGEGEGEE